MSWRTAHGEDGFTLIELLTVVLILGILVTIVIASYGSTARRAAEVADRSNLRIVRQAVARYSAESSTDAFPPTLDALYPDWISSRNAIRDAETYVPYQYDPATGAVADSSHPDR